MSARDLLPILEGDAEATMEADVEAVEEAVLLQHLLRPAMEETKVVRTEIVLKADKALKQAQSIVVTNQDQYNAAEAFIKVIKALLKEVDDYFDSAIKKAHQAHKAIVEAKKKQSVPLEQAEKILKQRMTAWYVEQERKRMEEESRIQREIEEKQAKGEPIDIDLALPKEEGPDKGEGISFAETWRWEVTDFAALQDEYKLPDQKKINGLVGHMKVDAVKVIKGIKVWSEKGMRVR